MLCLGSRLLVVLNRWDERMVASIYTAIRRAGENVHVVANCLYLCNWIISYLTTLNKLSTISTVASLEYFGEFN